MWTREARERYALRIGVVGNRIQRSLFRDGWLNPALPAVNGQNLLRTIDKQNLWNESYLSLKSPSNVG